MPLAGNARWLLWRCVAVLLVLAGGASCAQPLFSESGAPPAPPPPVAGGAVAAPPLTLQRLADGVYVAVGAVGEAAPDNGGHVFNTGVLVGRDGVVVVDPGPTAAFGARLRAAIAAVTPLPVVLLVITHPQAEVALAGSAFAGVRAIAHADTARFMRNRCPACLAGLRDKLGAAALAGTDVIAPDAAAAGEGGGQSLQAGGRRLRLLSFTRAASLGDLAVLDEDSGTLFAGALAAGQAVPDLHDGQIDRWLDALSALAALRAARVVPGQGVPAGAALADTRAYLQALDAAAEREVAAGADLARVAAPLPAFAPWPGYELRHAANLRRAFVRAESRWLQRE